eukprot:s200_g32.t1
MAWSRGATSAFFQVFTRIPHEGVVLGPLAWCEGEFARRSLLVENGSYHEVRFRTDAVPQNLEGDHHEQLQVLSSRDKSKLNPMISPRFGASDPQQMTPWPS